TSHQNNAAINALTEPYLGERIWVWVSSLEFERCIIENAGLWETDLDKGRDAGGWDACSYEVQVPVAGGRGHVKTQGGSVWRGWREEYDLEERGPGLGLQPSPHPAVAAAGEGGAIRKRQYDSEAKSRKHNGPSTNSMGRAPQQPIGEIVFISGSGPSGMNRMFPTGGHDDGDWRVNDNGRRLGEKRSREFGQTASGPLGVGRLEARENEGTRGWELGISVAGWQHWQGKGRR
ncbi:hypothetical protein BJV77DRAFT_968591, partial [Russula vinacea]